MGWGGSAPAPDPQIGVAAQQQAAVATRQIAIAERQDQRDAQLQAEMAPIFKSLMQQNIDQGAKDAARSDSQWEGYARDFQPLESKMASTAANFDTEQRRTDAADQAVAQVGNQFDAQRRNLTQGLSDAGVQPGAGAAQSLQAQSRIEEAKASAGAGTQARRNTEMTGIGLVDNAARFGRNMPSTGLQVSQAAMGAGNNAVGLGTTQQQMGINSTDATLRGLSGAVNSYGNAGNLYLGKYNADMQGYNSRNAMIGDALKAVGSVAGAVLVSSKKKKHRVGRVNPEKAAVSLASTPVEAWRYKDGAVPGDDGRVRIGRYAEDAQAAMGLGDGETLDMVSENGLNQAAIQYLIHKEAKRDPKLRKQLAAANSGVGLSDPVEL